MSDFVYRISTAKEWEELQTIGSTFGGELDKSSAFIHLSKLDQVRSTLDNFFFNYKDALYLLQIDAKKLGDGLVYEIVDGSNSFPHFYGPSRSFSPLTLDVVTKAEKLSLSNDVAVQHIQENGKGNHQLPPYGHVSDRFQLDLLHYISIES